MIDFEGVRLGERVRTPCGIEFDFYSYSESLDMGSGRVQLTVVGQWYNPKPEITPPTDTPATE